MWLQSISRKKINEYRKMRKPLEKGHLKKHWMRRITIKWHLDIYAVILVLVMLTFQYKRCEIMLAVHVMITIF
jgi:magnesium-transporting ATPase (P-type)